MILFLHHTKHKYKSMPKIVCWVMAECRPWQALCAAHCSGECVCVCVSEWVCVVQWWVCGYLGSSLHVACGGECDLDVCCNLSECWYQQDYLPNTHTHTHMNTHTHEHIHTHTYIYIYTLTHTQTHTWGAWREFTHYSVAMCMLAQGHSSFITMFLNMWSSRIEKCLPSASE